MKLFQKILALTLVFSLLGQNVLFAQTISTENLKDIQTQANKDIQELGLTDNQKTFLSIGGTAVLTFLVTTAIHKYRSKVATEELKRKFAEESFEMAKRTATRHAEDVAKLQAEFNQTLAQGEKKLAALQEELRITTIKKNGLEKSVATQKAKREAALLQLEKREAELQAIIAEQKTSVELYQDLAARLSHVDFDIYTQMEKYTKLFDETVPKAERNLLRTAIPNEPWFKTATKEQQELFLKYLDDALGVLHNGNSIQGASHILNFGARRFLPQAEASLFQRLLTLSHHVATKKNMFAIGLLALLGVSAHTAQAQTANQLVTNRINTNFNLFLDASEEDLQKIANIPQAVEVCVQGAYAIHMMKALPNEEIQEIARLAQEEGNAVRQNTYQGLRSGASY